MARVELKWVTSAGGPQLVIPFDLLHHWQGDITDRPPSDYKRACALWARAGVLAVGPGEALVLCDQVVPTTWIPNQFSDGGYLVRCFSTDEDDDAVVTAVLELPGDRFDDVATFAFQGTGQLLVIDAADVGNDLILQYLQFDLEPGAYSVAMCALDDGRVDLIAFRLGRLMGV